MIKSLRFVFLLCLSSCNLLHTGNRQKDWFKCRSLPTTPIGCINREKKWNSKWLYWNAISRRIIWKCAMRFRKTWWNLIRQANSLWRMKSLKLTQDYEKEGFLRCRAFVTCQGREYEGVATVGFSPEKLQPTTPLPADFLEFWKSTKEAAEKWALEPIMTLLPEGVQIRWTYIMSPSRTMTMRPVCTASFVFEGFREISGDSESAGGRYPCL